ncbi:hypothetical protein [Xenorhabdus thailandensis]|uniref:hypothetical protein n=1 Tax=Xenorhabdus thailandensis TaxID=3136255 RepID=UPI0030F3FC4A
MPVENAIAHGHYSLERADKDGYSGLAVSEASAIEMARQVSEAAIEMSKTVPSKLSFLSYSSVHDNGVGGFWAPASYLQKELKAQDALAMSITQGCNSLVIAVLTASKMLSSDGQALIVCSDQFSQSSFNRWSSDAGVLYGDAAVGVILSKSQGFGYIR